MTDKIFGYAWEDIQRAQQGGRLARRIAISAPLPAATGADRALLAKFGSIEALRAAGMHGVIDRLSRS